MTPDPLAEALHNAVHEVEEVACRHHHAEFFTPFAARLRASGVVMAGEIDVERLARAWNNTMTRGGAGTFVTMGSWREVAREYAAVGFRRGA